MQRHKDFLPMPKFNFSLTTVAVASLLTLALQGCGGSDSPDEPPVSAPDATMNFNRVASFPVCSQVGSSCESDVATAPEIAAASSDGMPSPSCPQAT